VIALSVHTLSEVARKALYTWSLFLPKPNRFSEHVALVVAGCGTQELDLVVDLGLLKTVGTDYQMYQTITDYCQLLLPELEAQAADPTWLEKEKSIILLTIDAAARLEKQLELVCGHVDQAEEVAQQALAIIEPFQTKNQASEQCTILAQIELAREHYAEQQLIWTKPCQSCGSMERAKIRLSRL
ncbi:MAG: hypothetical protein ACRDHZ_25135, partial [Ktedonobacteraceae bacterium]